MGLVITIGGATVAIDEGSLEIAATASGVDRLTCAVTSADGSVRPAMDAEVIATRDGTRIFGGILDAPEEAGFQHVGLVPITTKITAKDFNVYAEWRLVFLTIPAGTLKAALTALLPYLSPYGVTLDPAQVNGPSLPEVTYSGKTVAEVFTHLEQLTEYMYLRNISYTKVLGFYAIGGTAAAFDVADGDSHVEGDLSVRPQRTGYANRVFVFAGSGQSWVSQSWTCSGSETSWVTPISAAGPTAGYVHVVEPGGAWHDATLGTGAMFEWDSVTHTLSVGTHATPTSGTVLTLSYLAQWPYIAQADDPAEQAIRGIREFAQTAASLFDPAVADAMAAAELARRLVSAVRLVKYATYDHGLMPGQVQTITKSGRHVSATFLITDVVARDVFSRMRYEVTALEGSLKRASWRDLYRGWSGAESASSGSVMVGPGGVTMPAWVSSAYLGGSRNTAVRSDGATFRPISNHVPFLARETSSVRFRVELWAAAEPGQAGSAPRYFPTGFFPAGYFGGLEPPQPSAAVGVLARVWNVTDATAAATVGPVAATVPTEATGTLMVVAGKRYRVEARSDTPGRSIYAAAAQLDVA